jgi:hypothetical protein
MGIFPLQYEYYLTFLFVEDEIVIIFLVTDVNVACFVAAVQIALY